MAQCGTSLARSPRERRRPLLRSGRRRWHPLLRACVRRSRGAHRTRYGHRERHDELHTVQDDQRRQRLRRRLEGSPGARLRRIHPPRTWTRSTRRPRCKSFPRSPSERCSTARRSREGITTVRAIDVEFATRAGYVIKLLGVPSAWASTASRVGPTPRWSPASTPGVGARGHERGVRRGHGQRPSHVAGQGAGGAPTATRCSATSWTRRATA